MILFNKKKEWHFSFYLSIKNARFTYVRRNL